jgi:hypothetical protein
MHTALAIELSIIHQIHAYQPLGVIEQETICR